MILLDFGLLGLVVKGVEVVGEFSCEGNVCGIVFLELF